VVTPHWTGVFGCGDGFYAINGEVVEIPPRPGNQPEYLAYKLLSEIPKGFEQVGLKVLKVVDTLKVSSVVIATDGIEPIATRSIHGFSLAQVWESPQFRDPEVLMNNFNRLSEDKVECQLDNSVYPPQGQVAITPGIFADDTTLVYTVRNPGEMLPVEWSDYRRAHGLKLGQASPKTSVEWFGSAPKSRNEAIAASVAVEQEDQGGWVSINPKVQPVRTKRQRSLLRVCTALLKWIFRRTKTNVPKDTKQHASLFSGSKKER
jgi:hypothetical protein